MSAVADGATIELAGRALIEATEGPARVILFGSRARGDGDDRSDFDFLVIKRDVQQTIEKRLKSVLMCREVAYDRTHSIGYLTSLFEHHGLSFPTGVSRSRS